MRDKDQLVLDAVAGRRPNSKNKVRANCPWCLLNVGKEDRKQCLELDVTSGYWKCYRCDSRGRLQELPHDVSSLASAPKEEQKRFELPDGYIPLWTEDGQSSIACAPARAYVLGTDAAKKQRGVSPAVVQAAKIGACVRGKFAGRVVVPIYKGGKLAGYVGRIWKKKGKMPYLYAAGMQRYDLIYNEEALYVTTDEPVLVVEGVFDTFPFWPNAVAMLGKPSAAQFEQLAKARRPVALVFDGDAHREGTAMAMGLRRWGVRAVSLKLPPGVDPDEAVAYVLEQTKAAFAA